MAAREPRPGPKNRAARKARWCRAEGIGSSAQWDSDEPDRARAGRGERRSAHRRRLGRDPGRAAEAGPRGLETATPPTVAKERSGNTPTRRPLEREPTAAGAA